MSDRGALLVTGGAGFVGSHFVRLAVEAGRAVVVLDDLSGGEPAPMPRSTALVVGDIGDRRLVERVVRDHGVEAVAHFAGKIQVGESVTEPQAYFDVNVVRSLGLLAALRDAGVESFLFSSTAAVYGPAGEAPLSEGARREPENPYGRRSSASSSRSKPGTGRTARGGRRSGTSTPQARTPTAPSARATSRRHTSSRWSSTPDCDARRPSASSGATTRRPTGLVYATSST